MKKLSNLNLIFRGSRDGFRSSDFHKKCDNKGSTISIIKDTRGYVFGGYTSVNWRSDGSSYNEDSNAFLFSLNKKLKFPVKAQYKQYAMYHSGTSYSLNFGANDLILHDYCN